jgi:predicted MFS family arabinose efflux permease
MHRVTRPDGTRVKDRLLKFMRTTAYLLMGVAGVFCILSPILTDIYTTLAEVMAWFLVVGGFCSFVGSWTERWWGEYVGIPLLSSSFAVFAVISFAGAYGVTPYLAIANFSLLLAVSLGLLARWRDARSVYRLAIHLARRKEGL